MQSWLVGHQHAACFTPARRIHLFLFGSIVVTMVLGTICWQSDTCRTQSRHRAAPDICPVRRSPCFRCCPHSGPPYRDTKTTGPTAICLNACSRIYSSHLLLFHSQLILCLSSASPAIIVLICAPTTEPGDI